MQPYIKTDQIFSVSQAIKLANIALQSSTLVIEGEVTSIKDGANYKAIYFSIKDDKSTLSCLVWKNVYRELGVELTEGALVQLTGNFSIYAARGSLSFDVKNIELAGEGKLRMKVAKLAEKLRKEGLFDDSKKLPLPKLPRRIGLVTSGSGAVVHDVIRTVRRRAFGVEIVFCGVQVEGDSAPKDMIHALKVLQGEGVDVIILGRGGGSFEDLMPFNDEDLAREIASSIVPIVTGIGHEPDNSIADMAASRRASTPTAAAEIVTQGYLELAQSISVYKRHLESLSPASILKENKMAFDFSCQRFLNIAILDRFKNSLALSAKKLEALSPTASLSRGYAFVTKGDALLKSVSQVKAHDKVQINLIDGKIDCEVCDG